MADETITLMAELDAKRGAEPASAEDFERFCDELGIETDDEG